MLSTSLFIVLTAVTAALAARPADNPGLSKNPSQLTHPATGITCTLMIVRVDPRLDSAERSLPSARHLDAGIMGHAGGCVPEPSSE